MAKEKQKLKAVVQTEAPEVIDAETSPAVIAPEKPKKCDLKDLIAEVKELNNLQDPVSVKKLLCLVVALAEK